MGATKEAGVWGWWGCIHGAHPPPHHTTNLSTFLDTTCHNGAQTPKIRVSTTEKKIFYHNSLILLNLITFFKKKLAF